MFQIGDQVLVVDEGVIGRITCKVNEFYTVSDNNRNGGSSFMDRTEEDLISLQELAELVSSLRKTQRRV